MIASPCLSADQPKAGQRDPLPHPTPETAMPLSSLHALYIEELKDLYSAESQLLKALPRMAKASSAPELRAAFEEHLEVTRGQVERLDKIFAELGEKPRGKRCKAMEGLIEEARELLEEEGEPEVLDAALISAAQKVEHYEIAGYGCVRTFAMRLGFGDAARLLQTTLDEEGQADKTLTTLAETIINADAEEAGGDGEIPSSRPRRKTAARR